MSLKVCLSTAGTLMYPQGGHLWVFINWALGLRSCGCEVTWLDVAPTTLQIDELVAKYQDLRKTLHPFGLDANLIVDFSSSEDLTDRLHEVGLPSYSCHECDNAEHVYNFSCQITCLAIGERDI
jgi:hypothetical protein